MSLQNRYPLKSPLVASRLIDGEAVIIIPQDNEVKVLNEVGSRIWELLDGQRDMINLSALIAGEFDVSPDQALEDITEFIADLWGRKMVVLHDRPPVDAETQQRQPLK